MLTDLEMRNMIIYMVKTKYTSSPRIHFTYPKKKKNTFHECSDLTFIKYIIDVAENKININWSNKITMISCQCQQILGEECVNRFQQSTPVTTGICCKISYL